MDTFKDRFRALVDRRIAEGRYKSYADFARMLGCGEGRVGHWLTGRSEPNQESTCRICEELRTHPNYLFGYSEDHEPRYTENVSRIATLEKEINEIRRLLKRSICG